MGEGRRGVREGNRAAILVLLLCVLTVGVAAAQEPPAEAPPGEENQREWGRPEPLPPFVPERPVKMRVTPPAARPVGPPGPARGYTALQAVSTKEGEAIVKTGDGTRSLKPGDPLGTDVVKAVDEGVLVLSRPAVPGRPGGEATVVIRFDAQGRPTVRIYHEEDPTRVEPRETR